MDMVRVSSKGQIVIPRKLREAHRVVPGARLVVTAVGDELRLRPAPLFAPATHAQAAGCLRRTGRRPPKAIDAGEVVRRRARRLDDATKST